MELSPDEVILINQSGRGDKDIFTIAEALGDASWRAFLRDKVAALGKAWDMSRAGEMAALEAYIRKRLQRKKLLLMTHAVVGYPSLEANMAMLEAMQRADADLVELQFPSASPLPTGRSFSMPISVL